MTRLEVGENLISRVNEGEFDHLDSLIYITMKIGIADRLKRNYSGQCVSIYIGERSWSAMYPQNIMGETNILGVRKCLKSL